MGIWQCVCFDSDFGVTRLLMPTKKLPSAMNTNRAVFLNIFIVQTKPSFVPGANHRVKFFFSVQWDVQKWFDQRVSRVTRKPTKLLETNHFLFLLQIPDLATKHKPETTWWKNRWKLKTNFKTWESRKDAKGIHKTSKSYWEGFHREKWYGKWVFLHAVVQHKR